MPQEDKDLLLKDLCARLPYGVKAILSEYHIDEFPYNGTYCDKVINLGISGSTINLLNHIEKYGVRPYLRPMSSMTEEERIELSCLFGGIPDEDYIYKPYTDIPYSTFGEVIDWLNAHHFDYRGLIERDLAIKATEGMYK